MKDAFHRVWKSLFVVQRRSLSTVQLQKAARMTYACTLAAITYGAGSAAVTRFGVTTPAAVMTETAITAIRKTLNVTTLSGHIGPLQKEEGQLQILNKE